MASRKELFKDFYSNVTLHGFRFLFEGSKIRRLQWLIIMIANTAVSFILVRSLLIDYFSGKTSIVTSNFKETTMIFPTITICPMNLFNAESLQGATKNLSWSINMYFDSGWIDDIIDQENVTMEDKHKMVKQKLSDIFTEFEKNNITNDIELQNMIRIKIEDLLEKEATESLQTISGLDTCDDKEGWNCKENFGYTVLRKFGYEPSYCIQYNPYRENFSGMKTLGTGIRNSFNLFLDINETLPMINRLTRSVRIFVNDYGSAYDEETQDPLHLSPGVIATVKLDRIQTSMEAVKGSCVSKYDYGYIKNRKYTKELCKIDCRLRYLYEEFGCINFFIAGEVADEKDICPFNLKWDYETRYGHLSDKIDDCVNGCKDECVRNSYEIDYNQMKMDKNAIHRYAMSESSDEELDVEFFRKYVDENILVLRIYIKSFVIKKFEIVPSVLISTLIATIGGTVGLATGFSFTTLFEFIFFIYDITIKWKSNNRKFVITELK